MRLYAKRRVMSSGVDKDLVAGWKQVTQLNMTARMGQVHHVRLSTLCSVLPLVQPLEVPSRKCIEILSTLDRFYE